MSIKNLTEEDIRKFKEKLKIGITIFLLVWGAYIMIEIIRIKND